MRPILLRIIRPRNVRQYVFTDGGHGRTRSPVKVLSSVSKFPLRYDVFTQTTAPMFFIPLVQPLPGTVRITHPLPENPPHQTLMSVRVLALTFSEKLLPSALPLLGG